jgi:hypothetical protein
MSTEIALVVAGIVSVFLLFTVVVGYVSTKAARRPDAEPAE